MSISEESRRIEMRNTLKRARITGWALVAFYPLTIVNAYMLTSSPEIQRFYLWLYGTDTIFLLLCAWMIHKSHTWWGWRCMIGIGGILPVLVETAVSHPLIGPAAWWASLAASIMGMQLFTRDEWRPAIFTVALIGVLGTVAVFFQPNFPHIPMNEMSHGHIRHTSIQIAMAIAAFLPIFLNNQIRDELRKREEQVDKSLEAQAALTAQLKEERDEAEKRRELAEAALAEVSRLREEEYQRAQREAFFMRYEKLMRIGYELSRQDFAQKLLDALSEDLSVLGGLWYEKNGEGWYVTAAYAFPQKIGTQVKGGIIRIAELLKKPHILAPVPESVKGPRSALLQPKPVAILYLPFYSEVSGEVVAVAELLLSKMPDAHTMTLMTGILPQIGTYWWGRRDMPASVN